MLYDDIAAPGETTPADLRARYEDELADVIAAVGVDDAAADSGVDRETVAALAAGESPTVTVEDAAALAALAEDEPAADTIVLEVRDALLMGMTTAVLDVDTIASELDGELDAREIQQKVEGRLPMTIDEYASLRHFIASRKP